MKKTNYPLLQVLSLLFIATFVFSYTKAQKVNSLIVPASVNCTELSSLPACTNYLLNNTFTPSANYTPSNYNHYTNPFYFNFVPNWANSHGSPQIYDGVNFLSGDPLPPFTGAGWSYLYLGLGEPTIHAEGIVQKIPKLMPGREYILSFFRQIRNLPNQPSVDNFEIYAMKCSDFSLFNPASSTYPSVPLNSKKIYCETQISDKSWKRVIVKFNVNDNYDMLWIYPKQNNPQNDPPSGLYFSYPQIIDDFTFTAGPTPTAPTSPNCNVLIGPQTPNCSALQGAIFTWTSPSGVQTIVPANDQRISVNTAQPNNVGTWTLSMTFPNFINSNTNCGSSAYFEATVVVSGCINTTCTTPTITPSGSTTKCVWYETGPWLTLSTNLTSNIQWYDDGIAIPGGTTQTITLNNNPGSANTWPTYTGHITVRNTLLPNCISQPLTVVRKNYSTPWAYPGQTNPSSGGTPVQYCKSQVGVISQTPSISDPNTIFWWEVLDPSNNPAVGVIINPMNTTNNIASISFANYNHSTATIVAKSLDNSCSNLWNYTYQVSINQSCFSNSSLILYPNPATSQVTISTTDNSLIQSIEIGNLFNPIIKRVFVSNTKSSTINVSALSPGIYNCKITTNKGIEYQKLIIKR